MRRALVLALLLAGSAGAVTLCRVDRTSRPGLIPGMYTVTISTVPDCPPDGLAIVRLISGRAYPFEVVTPGNPYVERGVPWYWKAQWASASRKLYTFKIPGMKAPWAKP